MNAYLGVIKVVCKKESGCLRNLHLDVQPGCMDCPEAECEILDTTGKVIYRYVSPEKRTGERIR